MAPSLCSKCDEKLPENGNHATCSVCHNGLHLDKCSVKTKSWNSMGVNQATWVCYSCRLKKKGGSTTTQKESDGESSEDDLEVSSLGVQKSILEKVTCLMDMRDKLTNIEASLSFLASKYDALITEITGLREENKELKKEVETLKNKSSSSERQAEELTCELSELNQYGRRMNLEIQGVRVEGDPRRENLQAVLKEVAAEIQVEFDPREIHQAHRLQSRRDGKPPTILIQYYSKTVRDTWLQSGRRARLPNVFFSENLCPQYRHLLREAKLKCKTLGYKFVWVKGGQVLVKRDEAANNVIHIKCVNDLKKIK